MNNINRNISSSRRPIRQLDEAASNRIAAGEVVERPASAVKELIENALDAEAKRVEIDIADGGKTLIRVLDDGYGIPLEELPLAITRHATSKIDGTDLLNIHSFGFRGEALPSIGAVARLSLTSRASAAPESWALKVTGGTVHTPVPARLPKGTMVEVRDLFHATPARLKFLRTDRAELQAIGDVVKRLALSSPHVAFTLRDVTDQTAPRTLFDVEGGLDFGHALQSRLRAVLGKAFVENSLLIDAERDGITLTGHAALPTYSRGAAVAQYLFVNGRPVRDKMLTGALRAAYMDVLAKDRYPAAVLFLNCPPELVDVNVHPAKTEVRFRDPGTARGLIVSALRHALAAAGHRASNTVGQATLGALQPQTATGAPVYQMDRPSQRSLDAANAWQSPPGLAEAGAGWASGRVDLVPAGTEAPSQSDESADNLPLGVARGQVHDNYIIAQTATGIVIVDQHAAHERLVYEQLKTQYANRTGTAQALLIPDIVELSADAQAALLHEAEALSAIGLTLEAFGGTAICVRETPALLGQVDAARLLSDIADELLESGTTQTVQTRMDAILSRIACHGSVRSGRRMSGEEMNALLRQMEATPLSGQCNHGRPTYVELPLTDIERLFGRT